MQTQLNQIQFRTSDGQSKTLADYSGKVVLVVNVASKCGLTPQYEGLESTFEKYKGQGFTVLGFPANEFAGQEPGTNEEIQDFCQMKFGIKFPVLEKIVVKGPGQHPLYKALTESVPKAQNKADSGLEKKLQEKGLLSGKPGDIMWNFEKFLINRQCKIVARFAPDVEPNDPMVTQAIETALKG
jgi:glutathione peroxidase